jgi:tetratricopeptide (TPR) repeat protein
VALTVRGKKLASFHRDLSPARPLVERVHLRPGVPLTDLQVRVTDQHGHELTAWQPQPRVKAETPAPATEPPAPQDIPSADELYVTGLHLEQYRHATRCPTAYWREALQRDPGDARCNNALGLWHLRRGEFAVAESHFRRTIERQTLRNANPADAEAHYHLGLCLRYQLDSSPKSEVRSPKFAESYAAFYKATWNQAWAAAGYHALAEMDCRRQDWAAALAHLDHSLRFNTDNTRARNLKALVLRQLHRYPEAAALLAATLALDPLDWWARDLHREALHCDLQACLDLAYDYARAGFYAEATRLLQRMAPRKHGVNGRSDLPDQSWGAAPLVAYALGWLYQQLGDPKSAFLCFQSAAVLPPDYCFPARLEDIAILEAAMAANPKDPRAPYYLGNLLYDRRRHEPAISLWERSAKLDPKFSVVWRNLGIAYFNIRRQPARARAAYARAFRANSKDARLLYERDQLWKRLRVPPARRLRELEKYPALVLQRDDLSVELCALYNQTRQPAAALALVSSRNFQPWEGGEGGPLGQWLRANLALGRAALAAGDACVARDYFASALTAPRNLGEAKHLLANQSDVHYWLGCAAAAQGDSRQARQHWLAAATFKGDFQEMSVRAFSELTYYSALSWERLGQKPKAAKLFRDLLRHALQLEKSVARIDYFATSLPTMLLFADDLQARQTTTALFLQAQAHLGLGSKAPARRLLRQVLARDPNHPLAADLLRENL